MKTLAKKIMRSRLGVEQLGERIVPATVTWNYTGGGYGDAGVSSNWLNNTPPSLSNDDIVIPANTGDIDSRGGISSCGSISIGAGWNGIWKTGALSVGYGIVNPSVLQDATFEMYGNIDFYDDVEIENSSFEMTDPAGETVTFNAGTDLKGNLNYQNIVNNGLLGMASNCTITAGGAITNTGEWEVSRGSITNAETFTNTGDFNAMNSVGVGDFTFWGYFYNNGGDVQVGFGSSAASNYTDLYFWENETVGGASRSMTSNGGSILVFGGSTFRSRYGMVFDDALTTFKTRTTTGVGLITSISTAGKFTFNDGEIDLGEAAASGAYVGVSGSNDIYFKGTAHLTINLDWNNGFVGGNSGWWANNFTIDNTTSISLLTYNLPTPIPANTTWHFLTSVNAISGDFNTWYGFGGSFGHSKTGAGPYYNNVTT